MQPGRKRVYGKAKWFRCTPDLAQAIEQEQTKLQTSMSRDFSEADIIRMALYRGLGLKSRPVSEFKVAE